MTNRDLARAFERLAELNEVSGASPFKVIAYQKVARLLGELDRPASEMSRAELTNLNGVGTGTADRILELNETGTTQELADLEAEVPAGVLEVMRVPGIGPKSAALFWKEAGVIDLVGLRAKLDTGELARLKGFGPKKLDHIRRGLDFAAEAQQRKRIDVAYALATELVDAMRAVPGVARAEYAGSLRRGLETIGDVDVLVALEEPGDSAAKAAAFDAFAGHPRQTEVILRGQTKCSIRTDVGMQADLRVVAPESFGAAWMYFTGSKEHNVRMRERATAMGLTLNEYGLADKAAGDDRKTNRPNAAAEEAVFRDLNLRWIPPELREDHGELEAADLSTGTGLPDLVGFDAVVAELHAHTTASDGVWSIDELADAALQRGCHTVAVTDHSKGQVQANGLSDDRLRRHIDDVHAAGAARKDIRILAGSEVDIRTDGRLDYPDELLEALDVVVASPHASLQQDPATATRRLLRAIESGRVHIMGHPTGRLVLRREGMSPDIRKLCRAAAANNVAMEINANAYRLDLRDHHARIALEEGCKLSVNTDAHGPGNMAHLRFGIATARRAGATADDIINCWPRRRLLDWLTR